jgi:hypothetical protein
MSTLRRLRGPLLILAAYAALTVFFTWPLAANFSSHVPGDGSDDPALAWNLWWVKYALLDLRVSPLTTSYMFYPVGVNLAYFTLTLLNAFAAIPLQALFGLIAASNLITVGYFVLAGYGAYVLALDVPPASTAPAVKSPAPRHSWPAWSLPSLHRASCLPGLASSMCSAPPGYPSISGACGGWFASRDPAGR